MIRLLLTAALAGAPVTIPATAWAQAHDKAGQESQAAMAHAAKDPGAAVVGALETELAAAVQAGGELITVDVLGMVCDFCATALTKTFGRRDAVAAASVDLDAKTLTIVTKPGETLSDETIADLVTRSGYKLETIRRAMAPQTGEQADASDDT